MLVNILATSRMTGKSKQQSFSQSFQLRNVRKRYFQQLVSGFLFDSEKVGISPGISEVLRDQDITDKQNNTECC